MVRYYHRFSIVMLLMLFITSAPAAQQDTGLQALLEDYRGPDEPAVVLHIWTPDASYSAASGQVQLNSGINATAEDRFRIGSISKTYTAATALQLVDAGLLALDAPLSRYLTPQIIVNLAGADDVTVYDLLTMSSGLAEYLLADFYFAALDDPTYAWTAAEALAFAYDEPASFAPGDDFEYSNTNYLLLQLIIEAVTGEPLHVVMRENILQPIGATQTYTQIQEALPGGFVHGYEEIAKAGVLVDLRDFNDGAGLGDGGLVATAADVARFYQALLYDEALLEADTLDQMLTDALGNEYGMGIEVVDDPDYGLTYGHSGAVSGFSSDVRYFWGDDVIVVLLHADLELDIALLYEAFEWVSAR